MNSYQRILPFVVILVIHNRGNCSDLTATFGNGVYNVSCTSPPLLTFYIYGYIQCQRACIRHSNCAWIRYVKESLTCSFYLDGDCAPGAAGNVIYLKRTEIEEKIGGSCVNSGCQADTVCVHLHDGSHICAPDEALPGISIQIEGSTQKTTGSTLTEGCYTHTACSTLPAGNYHSCTGCNFFLSCGPSGGYDMPCPASLFFDFESKTCVTISNTCTGP